MELGIRLRHVGKRSLRHAMIRVSLSILIFIYLFLFLATVFCTWIGYSMLRRKREAAKLRNRLRCTMCAFEFEDSTNSTLPGCPRCGSPNERYRFSTL